MPKQIWKIDRFEKGIISAYEARDLPPGTLTDARSCDLSTVGVIRLVPKASLQEIFGTLGYAGGVSGSDTTNDLDDYEIQPGYGYFYFAHDYTRPTIASTPAADLSEFYIIPYGAKFNIYATNTQASTGIWDANADNDRDLLVFQKNLKKDTTVKITNQINNKSIIAKVKSNSKYPNFYVKTRFTPFRVFDVPGVGVRDFSSEPLIGFT